jgi:8-oxo-dGTP diphosphatase
VRVVAGLIPDAARSGRWLVQQRLPGKSRALKWEFPGGKVEPGESDAAALMRECREELGVELRVGRELLSVVHAYPDLEVELVLLSAEIAEGVPQPLGAADLKLVEPAQMRALPFCEADVSILEALASGKLGGR